ncbi:hypothetical protein K469DRAFT_708215 [Zopfia rhizophila CBS 207.26]|uniref:Uncharacterized protein n=1 Tax=Zopfia rhizophila CBS 207.26 TaxID=1314779 RepID=A0A6A6E180_9PEZI|nr:hypothetical protein K469DRAFT_708215 [Zopfia rhizophila CBS 207.26]
MPESTPDMQATESQSAGEETGQPQVSRTEPTETQSAQEQRTQTQAAQTQIGQTQETQQNQGSSNAADRRPVPRRRSGPSTLETLIARSRSSNTIVDPARNRPNSLSVPASYLFVVNAGVEQGRPRSFSDSDSDSANTRLLAQQTFPGPLNLQRSTTAGGDHDDDGPNKLRTKLHRHSACPERAHPYNCSANCSTTSIDSRNSQFGPRGQPLPSLNSELPTITHSYSRDPRTGQVTHHTQPNWVMRDLAIREAKWRRDIQTNMTPSPEQQQIPAEPSHAAIPTRNSSYANSAHEPRPESRISEVALTSMDRPASTHHSDPSSTHRIQYIRPILEERQRNQQRHFSQSHSVSPPARHPSRVQERHNQHHIPAQSSATHQPSGQSHQHQHNPASDNRPAVRQPQRHNPAGDQDYEISPIDDPQKEMLKIVREQSSPQTTSSAQPSDQQPTPGHRILTREEIRRFSAHVDIRAQQPHPHEGMNYLPRANRSLPAQQTSARNSEPATRCLPGLPNLFSSRSVRTPQQASQPSQNSANASQAERGERREIRERGGGRRRRESEQRQDQIAMMERGERGEQEPERKLCWTVRLYRYSNTQPADGLSDDDDRGDAFIQQLENDISTAHWSLRILEINLWSGVFAYFIYITATAPQMLEFDCYELQTLLRSRLYDELGNYYYPTPSYVHLPYSAYKNEDRYPRICVLHLTHSAIALYNSKLNRWIVGMVCCGLMAMGREVVFQCLGRCMKASGALGRRTFLIRVLVGVVAAAAASAAVLGIGLAVEGLRKGGI